MVYGTQITIVTGANLNQLTSLGGHIVCFLAGVIIWSKQILDQFYQHWILLCQEFEALFLEIIHGNGVGYPLKWNMSWYLRHYFLKLSMDMVSDIHWSEICLDIWGIISWNGVRRDIPWKYLEHLIWLTSLEWWLVRRIIPKWPYFSYFRFCELSQFSQA